MLRRAIEDAGYSLTFWQPEASCPTRDGIIIIIQCKNARGIHFTKLQIFSIIHEIKSVGKEKRHESWIA